MLENLRALARGARGVGIRVLFVLHQQWTPGDYVHWRNPTPYQLTSASCQTFARMPGAALHDDSQVQPGDLLVSKHWASRGLANADLDHQLTQHKIQKIVEHVHRGDWSVRDGAR